MECELTLLLPYFDERGWLGPTIDSLVRQSDQRFRMVLVDNGSSDGSEQEAREHARALEGRAQFMRVSAPGKTEALAAAMRTVKTRFVSICDADTIYPPEYVANTLRLFAQAPKVVAVMAIDVYAAAGTRTSQRRISRILRKVSWWPCLCHAGGYAQSFCTATLRSAGGFDPKRWGFVLEDHEVMHRVMKLGAVRYAPEHYCFPSSRRLDRQGVSWTAFERLVYRCTPRVYLDWFFYSFLARRLCRRGGHAQRLREKSWTCPGVG